MDIISIIKKKKAFHYEINAGYYILIAASTLWEIWILKVTYQQPVIKYQYWEPIRQDNIPAALICIEYVSAGQGFDEMNWPTNQALMGAYLYIQLN